MKVLKFGGGCLKDVNQIKKLPNILKQHDNNIIIVVSAFGKLTNLLDSIYTSSSPDFDLVLFYFHDIIEKLELSDDIKNTITNYCLDLYYTNKNSHSGILSIGELVSSKLLSLYFMQIGFNHSLFNASKVIKTDNSGVNSDINWKATLSSLKMHGNLFEDSLNFPILTQGFISSSDVGTKQIPTCLGREGSDYSAAIFGHLLNVKEVVLFKDVNGIYSVDPKKNSSAKLFLKLNYQNAFKICSGASSVVHPKTIKKLEEKRIPLIIKNFNDLNIQGTIIN